MIKLLKKIKSTLIELPYIVWILLGANFIFFTSRFMVMPFIAIYFSEKLNLSPAEVGVLLGVTPLSSMIFSVIGGRLGDRLGVHRIYPFALIIPSISLLGYVFSSDYYVIAAFSIIAGMGWSIYNSSSNALLSFYTPEPLIEKVFSYNYWGINLGGMLGPLTGVLILGAGTSSFPLLIFAFILILIAVIMLFLFKQRNESKVELVTEKNQITEPKKSVFKQLLNSRVLLWMTLSYFLIFFIESQQESNIAQFFNYSFQDGVKLFGALLSMNTAIIVIVQPIVAQVIDRISVKMIFVFGNGLYFIGFVFLAVFNHLIWIWFLAFAFITLGELIIAPKMQGIIAKSAPDELKATYFSVVNMGGNLAYTLGPGIGGLILTFQSISLLVALLALLTIFQLTTLLLANKSYSKPLKDKKDKHIVHM